MSIATSRLNGLICPGVEQSQSSLKWGYVTKLPKSALEASWSHRMPRPLPWNFVTTVGERTHEINESDTNYFILFFAVTHPIFINTSNKINKHRKIKRKSSFAGVGFGCALCVCWCPSEPDKEESSRFTITAVRLCQWKILSCERVSVRPPNSVSDTFFTKHKTITLTITHNR